MRNDYRIEGNFVYISMTCQGKTIESKISKDRLDELKVLDCKLYGHVDSKSKEPYVRVNIRIEKGKQKQVQLHRMLTNCPKGMVVDHWDHDTLNNTNDNLSCRNKKENGQNRKGAQKNSKTGVTGVYINEQTGKYTAMIGVDGKTKYLGSFSTLEEAKARREAAEIEYGFHCNKKEQKFEVIHADSVDVDIVAFDTWVPYIHYGEIWNEGNDYFLGDN